MSSVGEVGLDAWKKISLLEEGDLNFYLELFFRIEISHVKRLRIPKKTDDSLCSVDSRNLI